MGDTKRLKGDLRALKLKNEELEETIRSLKQNVLELSPKPKKGKVMEPVRLNEE